MIDAMLANEESLSNLDSLCQFTGIQKEQVLIQIVKELIENALDTSGDFEIEFPDEYSVRVSDHGSFGIDPLYIEELFTLQRPIKLSDHIRLPKRGIFNSGFRIVTAAVLATKGKIQVATRSGTYQVIPQLEGTTILKIEDSNLGKGNSILVRLGVKMNFDPANFSGLKKELSINGSGYQGYSHPSWYTSDAFYKLAQTSNIPIYKFVAFFCGVRNRNEIIESLRNETEITETNDLTFEGSELLLSLLRAKLKPISPRRLGEIGDVLKSYSYHKRTGHYRLNSSQGQYDAEIPVAVEAWVNQPDDLQYASLIVYVNRSPIIFPSSVSMLHGSNQSSSKLTFCGVSLEIDGRPSEFIINIMTPYVPFSGEDKTPSFHFFTDIIEDTIKHAVSKAKKNRIMAYSKGKKEKEIVFEHLPAAINRVSGNGQFVFSLRQLFYAIRPHIDDIYKGKKLSYTYFCSLIMEYETEQGEIPGLHHEPRGMLYYSGLNQAIPIGGTVITKIDRPRVPINRILLTDKESVFSCLQYSHFTGRTGCAILLHTGRGTKILKDVMNFMDPSFTHICLFCIHDAEAAATRAFESLQDAASKVRDNRFHIIDLGLNPEEAIWELGLQEEQLPIQRKRRVPGRHVPNQWQEWLRHNYVELSAMSTTELISWLEKKIYQYID